MNQTQQAKPAIEEFHLDWLCAHFSVYHPNGYIDALPPSAIRPDLVAPTNPLTLLELKSRSYHGSLSRCQYYWWSCMVSQVDRYNKVVEKHGLSHAWLFLLVKSDQSLTGLLLDQGQITEQNITSRQLYVAPHGIERLAPNYAHPSQYYHLSEPRLQKDGFICAITRPGLAVFVHDSLDRSLADCFVYR